eukprot:14292175-Ditylum_brightwellii.AAC.1
MEKDNTMGKDWSMKHVEMEKFPLRNHMSALVSKLLKTDELIAKDLTELKSIVTSTHGDRYAALYNIQCYMKHPNLTKDEVETSIPHQHNSESFTSYINQIQNFIQREGLGKCFYTKWQTTLLVLKNLHIQYQECFTNKAERQFKHGNNKTNNILFCFWLTNITSAFYGWREGHKIELPTGGGRKQAVNQIRNDDDNEELTIFNSINQGQEKEKCGFCGMNHSTESCHKLINHVKAE